MFYKKCNTCPNKPCLKTKKICNSMERWLQKYVEVPQREKLMTREELALYEFLTQGIDNKEDMTY